MNWIRNDAPVTFGTVYDAAYSAIFTDDILALENQQPTE